MVPSFSNNISTTSPALGTHTLKDITSQPPTRTHNTDDYFPGRIARKGAEIISRGAIK